MCEAWLIGVCVRHDSLVCVCGMTHWCVCAWNARRNMRYDSFQCVTWLIWINDMTHLIEWNDSVVRETWIIRMREAWLVGVCAWHTRRNMRSHSFEGMTWPLCIYDMIYSCVWHVTNSTESCHKYEGVLHLNTACVQLNADRVALNLEILLKTCSTNQNSAHGIYDEYQVINDQSHMRTLLRPVSKESFKKSFQDSVRPYLQFAVWPHLWHDSFSCATWRHDSLMGTTHMFHMNEWHSYLLRVS